MKSNTVRKAVCSILIASMCASLASCRKEPEPTVTQTSETSETTETATETTTKTTETTETTVSGPDFSQKRPYILYEGTENTTTIYMNVNIDDYISSADGDELEVFEFFKLASDLGWLEKGNYTYDDYVAAIESDPTQTKIGHSNWFSYDFGDHRSVFIINEYIDDISEYGKRQVSLISFEYMKNEFTLPFYDDNFDNPAHAKVQLRFTSHPDNICYLVGGQHCICSRDDAIVIAYSLWKIANSADDNTVVSDPFEGFRTETGILQLP